MPVAKENIFGRVYTTYVGFPLTRKKPSRNLNVNFSKKLH